MPNKPTTVPVLDTNSTNRTVPASSKVTDGFVLNDILPASNVNYLWGWAGDWLTWLDATFGDGAAAGDLQFLGTLLELPTGDLEVTAGDTTLGGLLTVTAGLARFDAGVAIGDTAANNTALRLKYTSAAASGGEFCINAGHIVNSDTGSDPYLFYGLLDINHATGTVSSITGSRVDLTKEAAGDITNLYGFRALLSASDASDAGQIDNLYGYKTDISIGSNATCLNLYQYFAINPGSTGTINSCYGLYVQAITAGDVTNCGVYIAGASGGSTNNYSLWVDSGNSRFDGEVQAQTYRATESKILSVDWLNAVCLTDGTAAPSYWFPDALKGNLDFYDSAADSYAVLPLHMPSSGTITAARVRVYGLTTHDWRVEVYKKSRTATLTTNATTVASYSNASDNLQTGGTAGVWKTLTVSSGAFTADDMVWAEIQNGSNSNLVVGPLELTTTMTDVTTCKP